MIPWYLDVVSIYQTLISVCSVYQKSTGLYSSIVLLHQRLIGNPDILESRCTRWKPMWNILSRDFRNVCFQLLLLILPAIRKSLTHMRVYRAYVTTDGIPFTDFSCDKCWFIIGIWKYTYPCDRCHGGSHDTRGHNCSHSIVYFIVAVSITNDTKKRTIQFNQ